MIELIMVIIVLGILAAMALPRLGRDHRQEAADNVLSAIRYTQHLALTDNKENPAFANWQRALWQIRFENIGNRWIYWVGANNNRGNNINQNEAAIDPATGKLLYSINNIMDNDESPRIFLTDNYGINGIVFTNNCQNTGPNAPNVAANNRSIAFDYVGRPHRGVTIGGSNDDRTVVTSGDCLITFTLQTGESFQIQIMRETGYAFIVGQAAS